MISPEIRNLRVGFLATTFFRHSVGQIFSSSFSYIPINADIFLFYVGTERDQYTTKICSYSVPKRTFITEDYDEIRARIIESDLDILIEMEGITNAKVISILKTLPSDVITISWLGSDCSSAVDYVISDSHQSFNPIVRSLNIEPCYFSTQPFSVESKKNSRKDLFSSSLRSQPHWKDNFFFLYCGQKVNKINREWLQAALTVLYSFPDNADIIPLLFLKTRGLDSFEQHFINQIKRIDQNLRGLLNSRICFLPVLDSQESHRADLSNFDLALDTYPYNGCTTTIEALSVNVPVLTLSGTSYQALNGKSILKSIGLDTLVCLSYCEWKTLLRNIISTSGLDSLDHIRTLILHSKKYNLGVWNTELFTQNFFTALFGLKPELGKPEKHWTNRVKNRTMIMGPQDLNNNFDELLQSGV